MGCQTKPIPFREEISEQLLHSIPTFIQVCFCNLIVFSYNVHFQSLSHAVYNKEQILSERIPEFPLNYPYYFL